MTSEFDPKGRPCVVFDESGEGIYQNVLHQGEAVGFLDGYLGIQVKSVRDNTITVIEWFPKAWIISGRIRFYYGFNNYHLQKVHDPDFTNPGQTNQEILPENNNQNVELARTTNTAASYQRNLPDSEKVHVKLKTQKNNIDDLKFDKAGEYRSSASPTTILKVGEKIPEFQLYSTDGSLFSTSTITKKTILYFYPADGTEYCTIEAKGFSAVYSSIIDMGLDVIGVSPDNLETHNKFRYDENIPFHLLFDEESKVCDSFGLLQSPPPYEKIPVRVTFLIDLDRKILGVWNDIDVSTHSEDVISFVLEVLDKAN